MNHKLMDRLGWGGPTISDAFGTSLSSTSTQDVSGLFPISVSTGLPPQTVTVTVASSPARTTSVTADISPAETASSTSSVRTASATVNRSPSMSRIGKPSSTIETSSFTATPVPFGITDHPSSTTTFSSTPLPSSVPPSTPVPTASLSPRARTSVSSSTALLIALPITLAIAFIAASAFLYRRMQRRRTERTAVLLPDELPLHPFTSSHATITPLKGRVNTTYVRPEYSPAPIRPPTIPEGSAYSDYPSTSLSCQCHRGHTTLLSAPEGVVPASSLPAEARPLPLAGELPPLPRDPRINDVSGRPEPAAAEGERVMMLPWAMGERLLALLADAPPLGQGFRDGSPSVTRSETLPPYASEEGGQAGRA